MYPWVGGIVPQVLGVSGGMVPQMPGVSRGIVPQMPGKMMSGMMQGMPAAAGGSRVGVSQSPGDNVYRPSMDLLSTDSQSTPLETQFTGIETFSLEEFGISPVRESPIETPPVGKSKNKGKGTSESSREGDEGGGGRGGGRGCRRGKEDHLERGGVRHAGKGLEQYSRGSLRRG